MCTVGLIQPCILEYVWLNCDFMSNYSEFVIIELNKFLQFYIRIAAITNNLHILDNINNLIKISL